MAVLAASRARTSQRSPTLTCSPSLPPADEQDQSPMFEGDFFGTYEEDDLEWSDDSSDEEEGLQHNEEWEPPVDDQLRPPIQGDTENGDSNDSGTEE